MSLTSRHLSPSCKKNCQPLLGHQRSTNYTQGKPIVDLLSNLKKNETECLSRVVCVYARCIVRLPWSNHLSNNLTRRPFHNQKSSFCGWGINNNLFLITFCLGRRGPLKEPSTRPLRNIFFLLHIFSFPFSFFLLCSSSSTAKKISFFKYFPPFLSCSKKSIFSFSAAKNIFHSPITSLIFLFLHNKKIFSSSKCCPSFLFRSSPQLAKKNFLVQAHSSFSLSILFLVRRPKI